MLEILYPYEYVPDVFSINYKKLYKMGYRGLIFDIDNTLVHHGDNSNEKTDRFFRFLQDIGFRTVLLTNNDEERVKRFIRNINTDYVCDAEKPNPSAYEKAMRKLGMEKKTCHRPR
jgi:predicted HAD superfamily phosphohydrolase YqeG